MLLVEHVDFYFRDNIMGSILPCEITNTPGDGEKDGAVMTIDFCRKNNFLLHYEPCEPKQMWYLPAQKVDR